MPLIVAAMPVTVMKSPGQRVWAAVVVMVTVVPEMVGTDVKLKLLKVGVT